jgi:hypothetical protein
MAHSTKFIAAAVQMVASNDKAANLNEADHWVREAASQGARVVAHAVFRAIQQLSLCVLDHHVQLR